MEFLGDELAIEPDLLDRRRTLITNAARELERSKMARFDERSGKLICHRSGQSGIAISTFGIPASLCSQSTSRAHMTEPEVSLLSGREILQSKAGIFEY